jgi:hypothetical protein
MTERDHHQHELLRTLERKLDRLIDRTELSDDQVDALRRDFVELTACVQQGHHQVLTNIQALHRDLVVATPSRTRRRLTRAQRQVAWGSAGLLLLSIAFELLTRQFLQ